MPTIYSKSDLSNQGGGGSSYGFTIKNQTKQPLKKAALAWLDYDKEWMDSWGDPVDFPTSIAPGKSATVNMPKKLRIVSFKMKWFEGQKYKLMGLDRAPSDEWCYFTQVELTVDDWAWGPWFSIIGFDRVFPPK